jgi:hypothetical protein
MLRIVAPAVFMIVSLSSASLAQSPAGPTEPRSYSLDAALLRPYPARALALIRMGSVQQELKLTETQQKRLTSLVEQQRARLQKARQDYPDPQIFRAARNALADDCESALRDALEPGQRERLEQLQLQAQGPLAFESRPLKQRLNLSDDQADEIEAITHTGLKELDQASSVRIELDPGDDPQSMEAIRDLVNRLEFQLANDQVRHLALAGRATLMLRVAKVLTIPQRAAYRKMLGAPFDIEKLSARTDATDFDVRRVARSLGLLGQRPDMGFDVKIAHPAYSTSHPNVLIDEAHYNFHTSSGRYNTLASLITNDGYQVSPNRDKFTAESLRKCDVLVIANAMAAESIGSDGAEKPAFTDD